MHRQLVQEALVSFYQAQGFAVPAPVEGVVAQAAYQGRAAASLGMLGLPAAPPGATVDSAAGAGGPGPAAVAGGSGGGRGNGSKGVPKGRGRAGGPNTRVMGSGSGGVEAEGGGEAGVGVGSGGQSSPGKREVTFCT